MVFRYFLGFFVFLCFTLSLHAINTIKVTLSSQTSTPYPSYLSQNVEIFDTQINFWNRDNDIIFLGDYFERFTPTSGYYYDSISGFYQINPLLSVISLGAVIPVASSPCINTSTHTAYTLSGQSASLYFGNMDFSTAVVCINNNDNDPDSYFTGYANSIFIGIQSFRDISLDARVDRTANHSASGRYLLVEGNVTSQTYTEIDINFKDEVRVIGDVKKSGLRKQLLQNVYRVILNIPQISYIDFTISSLGSNTWLTDGGTNIIQDSVKYYGGLSGEVVYLDGTSNIEGQKTLIVEGGDVYITSDIRNSDNDDAILGIIALQKDGQGGNIYIDPSVTDIHAILYVDKSLLSYDGTNILGGNTNNELLANQLYIKGSIFSENTIGGGGVDQDLGAVYRCPYYVNTTCDRETAMTYDLNFFRRYILVSGLDSLNNPIFTPQFDALEAYIGDNDNTNTAIEKPGYERFPFIIEYNPQIQQSPPPFF